ncbi:MAG: alginate lyase family protein [Mediterranea sp.]|jgi:hypothetical protein|nr:alginate lyase family protein [Mediterranea sp.]
MNIIRTINNIVGSGALLLTATLCFACSDIPALPQYTGDGSEGDDSEQTTLPHPCMLHTEADFEFIRAKVQAGAQPWTGAFAHLERSNHAAASWQANPVKKLARLDQNNWQATYPNDWSNYTNLMRDAASAYQLALRWKISGDDTYATAAIGILNAWARTCTGYITNTQGNLIDPNQFLIAIQVHQINNAAEILRTSSLWAEADFEAYKKWVVDVFYQHASRFLQTHNNGACQQHYWLNWDLANMTAVLSIGILTDDQYKIDEAVKYFKTGIGNGNINNAVPYVYQDPDSNEQIGQCQESGRDQGHATLCVSLLGAFCQMAKNVGEDLFTYDNSKALAMCEYVGKHNYGTTYTGSGGSRMLTNFAYDISGLPFTAYENCSQNTPNLSAVGRGTVRPAWELIHRLATDYGLSDIYTRQWVEMMRGQESLGNSDGGQGDYGPNSGGYDQLGYGTLMFARE